MSLALAPAPASHRPRSMLFGSALAAVAGTMLVGTLLAVYLGLRDQALGTTGTWFPAGVVVPEVATNIMLLTMISASIMIQWAVYAVARSDRPHAYMALGLTTVFGVAVLNAQSYTWIQMKVSVRGPSVFGPLFYSITGLFFAGLVAVCVATLLLTFRTLGGRYSARDAEGLSAAALLWHFLTVAFIAVWLVVYVTK